MSTENEKFASLVGLIKGDIKTDVFTRSAYATDASIYQIIPACVAYPRDGQDVCAIVKWASRNNMPVGPRGAASGLAGECLTTGIVLDFTRYMNKFTVANDGLTITAQPGAVLDDVNAALAKFKRKIGPDPSSSNRATIGGCVANNATGAHWLKYGYFARHVKRIETVLANGSVAVFENNTQPASPLAKELYALLGSSAEVIKKAKPRTKRSRAGYNIADVVRDDRIDMAAILAGSEGTLAIYTEITLATVPIPAVRALIQTEFASLENMAHAIEPALASDIWACELMDRKLIEMTVQAHPEYNDILPVSSPASLLIEQCGDNETDLDNRIGRTLKALEPFMTKHTVFKDAVSQSLLWKSRKDAVPLLFRGKGDKKPIPFIEDISVPPACLARYVTGLSEIAKKHDNPMAYYGHAGDGEIHVRPYLDLGNIQDLARFQAIAKDTFELALSLGGTISGEHAVGIVRSPFIKKQFGPAYYELLKKIKLLFDPTGILNRGKIINDVDGAMISNLRTSFKAKPELLKTNLNFDAEKFRLEIEQCCGDALCRANLKGLRMCPSFRADPDEMNCPRARANLLRFYTNGLLSQHDFDSARFKTLLDSCINCKMCSIECPSGVDVSDIIMEARARHAALNGLPLACWVLGRNRYLSTMGSTFAPIANIILGLGFVRFLLEKCTGLDRRRRMPNFCWGQFIPRARKYLARQKQIANTVDKVAYFVDTFVNFNDHAVGWAVLKVLEYNNVQISLPDQLPAPLPAAVYGDSKKARTDIAAMIKPLAQAVRDGYKIVCSEPSAALFLRSELLLFNDSEDAKLVSSNSYELMSYLLDLQNQGKLKALGPGNKANFDYHTPCHLLAMKQKPAALSIFKHTGGISVTDLNSSCCGLAGTFGMQKKNYEKSLRIAQPLREALENSKSPILTECSACRMQIEHLSSKQVCHPVQIMAQAYGLA